MHRTDTNNILTASQNSMSQSPFHFEYGATARRALHAEPEPSIPDHLCGQDDLQFVEDIQTEETCVAGRNIALTPYTTNCLHTYCERFVSTLKLEGINWFRCFGQDNNSPNGRCQEVIIVKNMKHDRPLDNHIKDKKINCPKSFLGCTKIFQLRLLTDHMDFDCHGQRDRVMCRWCNKLILRRRMPEHSVNCDKRQSSPATPASHEEDGCKGPEDGCKGPKDGCKGPEDGCKGPEDGCKGSEDGCKGPGCLSFFPFGTPPLSKVTSSMVGMYKYVFGGAQTYQREAILSAEGEVGSATPSFEERHVGRTDSDCNGSALNESYVEQPREHNDRQDRQRSSTI